MSRMSGLQRLTHEAKRIPLPRREVGSPVSSPSGKIAFPIQNGIIFIDPSRVSHLTAQSNYTLIHLTDRKPVLVSKTLKYCAGVFPENFLRIHQSYLVNPQFLAFYHSAMQQLELDDGTILPVSRSGKKRFRPL